MSGKELSVDQYFKVLQDPIRRAILKVISDRESSFSEIRDDKRIRIPPNQASKLAYHLQQLEKMKLIRKDEDDRYHLTEFAMKLLRDMETLESTIRWGRTTEEWRQEFFDRYPVLPTYITEIEGEISVISEKFASNILIATMEDLLDELGVDYETLRYKERSETGAIKSGWLLAVSPTPWASLMEPESKEEELIVSGIIIYDDGTFNVTVCLKDQVPLFPYFDPKKHEKLIREGEAKLPFFFTQTMVYQLVLLLCQVVRLLWAENVEINLKPPKNMYLWTSSQKAIEVKVEPILWIDELGKYSWKEKNALSRTE